MEKAWEIIGPFSFQRRPRDLPGDLRVAWRVALVVLILGESSVGKKASLRKLHALNWICHSGDHRNRFLSIVEGRALPDDLLIRIEPSLNRAIDFAVGEGLVEWIKGNRIKLTEKGITFLQKIAADEGCMVDEIQFLRKIRTEVTETNLESIFSWNTRED